MTQAGKKLRVYEIAKDLKMSSDAVVEMIRALGVEVRGHMSTVDPSIVGQLHEKMAREKEVVKEDLHRKHQQAEAKAMAAQQAALAAREAREAQARAAAEAQAAAQAQAAAAAAAQRAAEAALHPAPEPTATVEAPTAVQAPPAVAQPPRRPEPPVRVPAPGYKPPAPRPQGPRPQGPRPQGGPPSRAPAPGFRPSGPRPQPGAFAPAPGIPPAPPRSDRGHGGGGPGGPNQRRRDKKKKKPVDERMVLENVRKTLAQMDQGRAGRRRRRDRESEDGDAAVAEAKKLIRVTEFLTVAELAAQMGVKPQEVIAACLELGLMVNINRRLDKDMIAAVADEFGFDVEFVTEYGAEQMTEEPVNEA
ncbi:MAG TPA: translation initiation factor IF-2 N-terminal domain-containing protein, partial [Candidatus Eisenbacteria bacterium]|nr:translation initiation factor IF-2 N-terminal domain-containing protein [Candidatus Eisenbacteria bacterium]